MAIYREDDDLDLERELAELEQNMDRNAKENNWMKERAVDVRKRIEAKQIDPLVKEALKLAQNLGHALGANESLSQRLRNLNTRIDIRDKEIERTDDRDIWKKRAEAAEATIERSKKLKSRRR